MSERLGAAVIGLGMMGERHARVWAELPATRLVSVYDIVDEPTQDVAGDLGCAAAGSLEEAIGADGVEIVSVCTDDQAHREACVAAAEAGRHVLVEKPLATTLADCDAIIEACDAAGVKLMTGHICRFDACYVRCRDAVASGEVGDVVQVFARRNNIVPSGRRIGPRTSVAFFLGVHDIDLIHWVTGSRITRVHAESTSKVLADIPADDSIMTVLRLDNGAVGALETCWVIPEGSPNTLDARLEVVGTRGRVAARVGGEGYEQQSTQRADRPDIAYWTEMHGRAYGGLRTQLEHFAECVLKDREPAISPQDARQAVAVAAAIHESLERGAPVEVGT
ncbi:MAG: Gfo/Idh/MocA family oxidoreductase [Armatimonadota bacterium]|nr:Gfo/Idh/MocA family oxidoreductase [Armatimonadota bacterium]